LVHFQSVYTVPATEAVKIEFESLKVPPDSKVATKVASITFYREYHFYFNFLLRVTLDFCDISGLVMFYVSMSSGFVLNLLTGIYC